mmetsp:Transcript_46776/g.85616  ORF Transcript_46776/g.85616 Transcript_46776/m.85616 type:complete len:204 (+) Transcript_46776:835-1446(+)
MACFKYVLAKMFSDQGTCRPSTARLTSTVGQSTDPTLMPVHAKILVHDWTKRILMSLAFIRTTNSSLMPRSCQAGPPQNSMDSSTTTHAPLETFSSIHVSRCCLSRKSPVGLFGLTRHTMAASLAESTFWRPAFLQTRSYSRYCTTENGLKQYGPGGAARAHKSISSLAPFPNTRRSDTTCRGTVGRRKAATNPLSSRSWRSG